MNKIDEISKEFYGQYGLAMHYVHIIETGLLELYALKMYLIKNLSEIEYYKILSNPEKLTLGQINNKLFGLSFLEKEIKENLIKANKTRIFLAHRFWWEREILFDEPSELLLLHNELFKHIDLFKKILVYIDDSLKKLRFENNLSIEEKMGLTDFKAREKFIKSLLKTSVKQKQ